MEEDPAATSLARAVKTLTIAVWFLIVILLAQFLFYAVAVLRPGLFRKTASSTSATSRRVPDASSGGAELEDNDFHKLPPDEMARRSSAILLVKFQRHGEQTKAVVAEILKLRPDTKLYYAAGDEFPDLTQSARAGESYGEGEVVFLVGSPATMRTAYSYEQGRIGGLGDMPLATLRDIIASGEVVSSPTRVPSPGSP